MMKTNARQIVCEKEKTIKGKPKAIFPLLCPVLEEKWLPNWKYDLLYSKSGVNETGCIFREDISGTHYFGETVTAIWTTILHDPEAKRVEFIIVHGDRALSRSTVQVSQLDGGYSRVQWRKVLTSLSPKNDKFSDQEIKQKIKESLEFIADTLSYYCETGRMLVM